MIGLAIAFGLGAWVGWRLCDRTRYWRLRDYVERHR